MKITKKEAIFTILINLSFPLFTFIVWIAITKSSLSMLEGMIITVLAVYFLILMIVAIFIDVLLVDKWLFLRKQTKKLEDKINE